MDGVAIVATAFGHAVVAWRGEAVAGLHLPAETTDDAAKAATRRWPSARPGEPPTAVADAIGRIARYFAGEVVDFDDVTLDLTGAPDFHARVYAHIRGLRRGETTTYGTIAHALGAEPAAARSVGRAMATNPMPLIVPCHRVLGAGGVLGGFTAPGGLETKRRMLAMEGATVAAQRAFAF